MEYLTRNEEINLRLQQIAMIDRNISDLDISYHSGNGNLDLFDYVALRTDLQKMRYDTVEEVKAIIPYTDARIENLVKKAKNLFAKDLAEWITNNVDRKGAKNIKINIWS